MKNPLMKFRDSNHYYFLLDGKVIALESLYSATVYDLSGHFITYKSHIEHCDSCLEDELSGCKMLDECCCIHLPFHGKEEEDEYLEKIGFWKLKEEIE